MKINSLINLPFLSSNFLINEDISLKIINILKYPDYVCSYDPQILEKYEKFSKFENKEISSKELLLPCPSYEKINRSMLEFMLNLNCLFLFREDKLVINENSIKIIRPHNFIKMIPEIDLFQYSKKMKENFHFNIHAAFIKHYIKEKKEKTFSFNKDKDLYNVFFEKTLIELSLDHLYSKYEKIIQDFSHSPDLGDLKIQLSQLSKEIYRQLQEKRIRQK